MLICFWLKTSVDLWTHHRERLGHGSWIMGNGKDNSQSWCVSTLLYLCICVFQHYYICMFVYFNMIMIKVSANADIRLFHCLHEDGTSRDRVWGSSNKNWNLWWSQSSWKIKSVKHHLLFGRCWLKSRVCWFVWINLWHEAALRLRGLFRVSTAVELLTSSTTGALLTSLTTWRLEKYFSTDNF